MDIPLDSPDLEIFTDDSSFVWDEKHKAGYTVVIAEQGLQAKSPPPSPGNQCSVSKACGSDPSSRVKQRAASKYLHRF